MPRTVLRGTNLIMYGDFEEINRLLSEQKKTEYIEFNLSDNEQADILSNEDNWEVYTTDSGQRIFKWQKEYLDESIKDINKTRQGMREEYNVPPPPPWGMGKANFNSVQDLPNTVDQYHRNFQQFANTLERNRFLTSEDYAEGYKKNLLSAIYKELWNTKGGRIIFKEIKQMDAKEIVKKYFAGELAVDFDFIYSFEDAQNITDYIMNVVAPDRIKRKNEKK